MTPVFDPRRRVHLEKVLGNVPTLVVGEEHGEAVSPGGRHGASWKSTTGSGVLTEIGQLAPESQVVLFEKLPRAAQVLGALFLERLYQRKQPLDLVVPVVVFVVSAQALRAEIVLVLLAAFASPYGLPVRLLLGGELLQ